MSASLGRDVVPYRITVALDMRMLYGPEVDAALGVAEPTVDEWEAGTRTPSAAEVRKIALLTGMPVEFFYRPEPEGLLDRKVFVCGDLPDVCNCCHGEIPAPVADSSASGVL